MWKEVICLKVYTFLQNIALNHDFVCLNFVRAHLYGERLPVIYLDWMAQGVPMGLHVWGFSEVQREIKNKWGETAFRIV